jgi:hypothetical protein
MLKRVAQRSKVEGIAFDLTIDDVHIPEICPAIGIPMKRGVGRQYDNSPSLDRIDPKKGYVKGNVAVISFLANRIKTNATADQVEAVSKWIRNVTTPK